MRIAGAAVAGIGFLAAAVWHVRLRLEAEPAWSIGGALLVWALFLVWIPAVISFGRSSRRQRQGPAPFGRLVSGVAGAALLYAFVNAWMVIAHGSDSSVVMVSGHIAAFYALACAFLWE